jgi:phosphatidylglycerophosphatase A
MEKQAKEAGKLGCYIPDTKPFHESLRSSVVELLGERDVSLGQIADIVLELQKPYSPDLTIADCLESVERVLEKREVQYAVLTGITLDILAEKDALPDPLLSIIRTDDPLYGVDEILALSIVNVFGSIGLTSFGYLDKMKSGVLRRLNCKDSGCVNTFIDDIVAAIAAAAGARIAHHYQEKEAAAGKIMEA